jgi:glycosyltransferase involved in cell wall biosynthesis
MLPIVNIIITTYNRIETLIPTIRGLKKNLIYDNLQWIIADDGSNTDYFDLISAELPVYTTTQANRRGVGVSKNIALTAAFKISPFVLLLEDDWELVQPLHLDKHVLVLEQQKEVGMIRLGYLGGEMEAVYKDWSGDFTAYWGLKPASGQYVYSGQVSLRHKRFYDVVGYHDEGVGAGAEEEGMCHRYNDLHNQGVKVPWILWPGEYGCVMNAGPFINIGLDKSLNGVIPQ